MGDRHTWSETHRRPNRRSYIFSLNIQHKVYSFKNLIIFVYMCRHSWWVSDQACRPPNRLIGLRRSMGLRTVISVSNGSPNRHIGFQWVSEQAYWFPMGLRTGISVSNRSPNRHIGFQWVFKQAYRFPIGLWQLANSNLTILQSSGWLY